MYHGTPRVWRPMMKITSRQLRTRQPIGEQSAGREGNFWQHHGPVWREAINDYFYVRSELEVSVCLLTA